MKPVQVIPILLLALLAPRLAFAKFTVCNRTSQDTLMVATALTWYAQDRATGARVIDAESLGWAVVAKGSCVIASPDFLNLEVVYVFAYSWTNPSIKWTGKYNFCVDMKNPFEYIGAKRAQSPCPAGVPVGMLFVDTYGEPDYQYSIFDQH